MIEFTCVCIEDSDQRLLTRTSNDVVATVHVVGTCVVVGTESFRDVVPVCELRVSEGARSESKGEEKIGKKRTERERR